MSNEGKRVKVHYIGTFNDGEEFDNSYKRDEPLEFLCMAGFMIPGFDVAVCDMEVGQTIDIHLTPEEAYGPRREEDIVQVPVTSIPNGEQLPVGKIIYMQDSDGFQPVHVVSIENDTVTLDFNHPMAGKELNFNITLLEVQERPAPPEVLPPGVRA